MWGTPGQCPGAPLILIFINDMPPNINLRTLLFADDTSYQNCHTNLDSLIQDTNYQLNIASDWFAANKLSLNISKTKFIIFTPPGKPKPNVTNLNIGNFPIERISKTSKIKAYKYVGIWIDDELNWSIHLSKVLGKISAGSYAIARSKHLLPLYARLNIYHALVKSHLDYGLLAWSCAPPNLLSKAATIQKSSLRHVSKKLFNSHSEPLFKKLNIIKLYDLIRIQRAKFMFQLSMDNLPVICSTICTPLHNFNRTRNYFLHKVSNKSLQNSTSHNLITNWNKMVSLADKNLACLKQNPPGKQQINHLKLFETSLRQQTLAKYMSSIKCKNSYCQDCNP